MKGNQNATFARTLTLRSLVILGLAYMAPMTVFTTYGVVAQTTHGMVSMAYAFALAAMLFTAYSYGHMAKEYPLSGSAYTYTQKSISPHIGFMVGWSVLLDYLFLPMINFLLAGTFLSAAFPSIPSSLWILLFIVIITCINVFGIQMTAKVNGILVLFQFLVTALFVILSIKKMIEGESDLLFFSSLQLFDSEASFSFVLAGASILCLSFLGFDAVTTLSEETVDPKKNVPKAIFLVAFIGGILFILVSYITQLVYPNYHSFKVVDSASFEIAAYIGGTLFSSVFLAGIITSTIASGISSHASASRLLYAMGRESMLPKRLFAYIHPKYKTPSRNVIFIGVLSLSALVMDVVTAASFINFGALIAFTFVNISVIFHYYIRGKQRDVKGTCRYLISPIIGAVFTVWLWTSLDIKSISLGSIWVVIGFMYLVYKTSFFTKAPPQFAFDEKTEPNELKTEHIS
ncbi:APC family permease [Priestia megaterium]|uniref:APC family permease n=1 Tax=Priestia megaterium TaxID=1404 RepID=UPI00196A6CC1|nr:APC family permease [Priestia megaterium]QSF40154.1 APC family permease [Priestia megaterium]